MAKKIIHKHGRPTKGTPTVTRDLIVSKALNLVKEEGLSSLTLANVAKKLKIRTPSLYNHIQDLETLKFEIRKESLQLFLEYLQISQQSNGSKKNKIQTVISAYRSFAKEFPHLYELTLPSTEMDPVLKPIGDSILDLVSQSLGVAKLDESSIHKIRILRSVLHGFIDLELRGGFGKSESVEESFLILIDQQTSVFL
ncbi:MAG: TetR-like C-terminal domain-containing protein [Leptospira sp.]|nr:TetR-like C-terminal domain-containing protein [Leptospira sp.]